MKVAFLGLGAMGLPMAGRLLDAGFALRIMRHTSLKPVEELGRRGALVVADARELFAEADCTVSILPADRELETVFLASAEDALPRLGSLLIEMTTARPDTMRRVARRLEARGVRVVDAPVSGGVQGARDGTLSLLCGADEGTLHAADPILSVLGSRIYHVGGVGSGKAMKAVNQALAASHTALAAEALCMTRAMGLPEDVAYEVLCNSSGASTMLKSKFPKMRHEDYAPNFTVALMRKDLDIALAESECCHLPLVREAKRVFECAEALENGAKSDIASVYAVYAPKQNSGRGGKE